MALYQIGRKHDALAELHCCIELAPRDQRILEAFDQVRLRSIDTNEASTPSRALRSNRSRYPQDLLAAIDLTSDILTCSTSSEDIGQLMRAFRSTESEPMKNALIVVALAFQTTNDLDGHLRSNISPIYRQRFAQLAQSLLISLPVVPMQLSLAFLSILHGDHARSLVLLERICAHDSDETPYSHWVFAKFLHGLVSWCFGDSDRMSFEAKSCWKYIPVDCRLQQVATSLRRREPRVSVEGLWRHSIIGWGELGVHGPEAEFRKNQLAKKRPPTSTKIPNSLYEDLFEFWRVRHQIMAIFDMRFFLERKTWGSRRLALKVLIADAPLTLGNPMASENNFDKHLLVSLFSAVQCQSPNSKSNGETGGKPIDLARIHEVSQTAVSTGAKDLLRWLDLESIEPERQLHVSPELTGWLYLLMPQTQFDAREGRQTTPTGVCGMIAPPDPETVGDHARQAHICRRQFVRHWHRVIPHAFSRK
ncbi:hypothetical protein [Rhodopirellula bahusiensis]|uniref:hypothetical protein n=1 Tax=Rhodopirellula bahusiensis TaxID=2014065 RepID=UPI0032665173